MVLAVHMYYSHLDMLAKCVTSSTIFGVEVDSNHLEINRYLEEYITRKSRPLLMSHMMRANFRFELLNQSS